MTAAAIGLAATAIGGMIFQACGGVGLIVQAYRSATTWRETHRTLAPAFARGIDRITEASVQAITNTQAHLSRECSRITGKVLEIVVFGVSQYAISASYPASCKDRPDYWACTMHDGIQVVTTGFLAGASIYAIVQMLGSSKNSKGDSENLNTTNGNQYLDVNSKNLIAKQKALIEKRIARSAQR